MPRVTILIDSYNYSQYAATAIESALAQSYADIEVIVVDDGSTDGSQDVIRRYEPRIRAVYKSNGGQASAFNEGWKLATGDIIVLLDCDDALKPDAVERIAASWRPSYSKLHFPLEVCNENLQTTGARVPRAPLAEGNVRQEVLEKGIYVSPPTSGNAFSREFLDAVMPIPEPDWVQAADAYLIALAGMHGRIGAIREPLGYYRTHSASTTSAASIDPQRLARMLRFDLNLRKQLERFAESWGAPLDPEAGLNHWLHWKLRLAGCKLCGAVHPFPGDRPLAVALRLVHAVFAAPEVSPVMRVVFAVWALLAALLPKPFCVPMFRAALAPAGRPAFVNRLLALRAGGSAAPPSEPQVARTPTSQEMK